MERGAAFAGMANMAALASANVPAEMLLMNVMKTSHDE